MDNRETREALQKAITLFRKGYERQTAGRLEEAIRCYRDSIQTFPTAEAHTFLGWSYSFQGRYEDAILECRRAIDIDPEFGNPWNDIGAYLIELGRYDEAIVYLERAARAKRYDNRCFPHFNLSRIYVVKGMLRRATTELHRALQANPEYAPARVALERLETQLH